MALLYAAAKQANILRSYTALGSRNDAERYRAMEAMVQCGESSRWCLRIAIRQTGQPRTQFAAAVVLHRLGDAQGLLTLTEALKWRLPSEPLLGSELEAAFITIGSPDAVLALLTVWNMLPGWGDQEPVRSSICRIWAALRNPVVLPALAADALLNPDRFERTVPAFGEMAMPVLREMAVATDARQRRLAARTLSHIPGQSAFAALVPALRDSDPTVRALVPHALERTVSQAAAADEIAKAVREGHTSVEAMDALIRARHANLPDTLSAMLANCRFEPWDPAGSQIVLMTLPVLLDVHSDRLQVLSALCGLLGKPIESRVVVAIIKAIELLALKPERPDPLVMDSVAGQLFAHSAEIREQAALTLARLGDLFPARVIAFLEECKPQDSILSKLQVILRGGRDAGQAATEAVQQMSKWWTRLTSDQPEAPQSSGDPAHLSLETARHDPRLIELLRRMLASGVQREFRPQTPAQTEERTHFIVLVLRALARLGPGVVRSAWTEVVSALHMSGELLAPLGQIPDPRTRDTVAAAAAETLIAAYGADCFCLFLEAVYSPRTEIVRTGIAALGMLGDTRGLPHLRNIASSDGHPCSGTAVQAIAQIQRTNPQMMSLLRGSSANVRDPLSLLRAASGNTGASSSDLLLRPADEQPGRSSSDENAFRKRNHDHPTEQSFQ